MKTSTAPPPVPRDTPRTPRTRRTAVRADAVLLIDIGNTHTHLGLAVGQAIRRTCDLRTADWNTSANTRLVRDFIASASTAGACLCSVVPAATPHVQRCLRDLFGFTALQLDPTTIRGVGIRYPTPGRIGQDRLANAVAVQHHFGKPAVVVDFGTAVTFDVVDRRGDYVGGIIAPGLAAMTDYLHEKTALLPRIEIREPRRVIGKNTEEAMLIGAVHGYRGLVRELIGELKAELGIARLPVVATGGYAALIARKLPEITAVRPALTLEGLRLTWESHHPPAAGHSATKRAGKNV